MFRILVLTSFFFLLFGVNSVFAITLDKAEYCENEDVLITALGGGVDRNIWLYPYDTAANCRYYGASNCATGASTQASDLPLIVQNDSGSSPAEQTFGTTVVLGANTYYILETTTAQDCGGLSKANCEASGGYIGQVSFVMTDTCAGGGSVSSTTVFNTDEEVAVVALPDLSPS